MKGKEFTFSNKKFEQLRLEFYNADPNYRKEVFRRFYGSTIKDCQEMLNALDSLSVNQTRHFEGTLANPINLAHDLLHACLHRILELGTPSILLWEGNSLLAATIISRAMQETTGLMVYLHRMKKKLLRDSDIDSFNRIIIKLSIGTRTEDINRSLGGQSEAVQVMKLIDAVDKEYKKTTILAASSFRRMYDLCSEYSHPNYFGVKGTFEIPKEREDNLIDHANDLRLLYTNNLCAFYISLLIALDCSHKALDLRNKLFEKFIINYPT